MTFSVLCLQCVIVVFPGLYATSLFIVVDMKTNKG